MKLVILDSETVSQNDVSLEGITSLCNCEVYGYTPNELVASRIGDADGVICNKCLITREVFEKCKNLRYVGLFATGYNNVDLDAAKERGAVVANVPAYSTNAVAQHTFGFILDYFSRISSYAKTVADGDWINYKLFSYFYIPTAEIAGKTLGIIGYGDIGRKVAEIAKAFGMKVVTYTRTPSKVTDGTEVLPLDKLLETADVVSLHCPLSRENEKMINENTLKLMKKSAILINTARGGLVDEKALAAALKKGEIAWGCIDVLEYEPMREDCPYIGLENVTITPHVAWAPRETRVRLLLEVAKNLSAYIEGKPRNNVVK